LERLLFMMAVLNSTASPAIPIASTVIAITSSTSEIPRSADGSSLPRSRDA